MRPSRFVSSLLSSLTSLLLSYTLFITLCTPFIIVRVQAASKGNEAITPATQVKVNSASKESAQGAGVDADIQRSRAAGQADQFRVTPPAPIDGAPLPNLPNLDEIRTRQHLPPHAPPPIPSTRRRCPSHNPHCNEADGPTHPRPVHPVPLPTPPASQTGSFEETPTGVSEPYMPLLASLNVNWWDGIATPNMAHGSIVSDAPFSLQLPARSLNQTSMFAALAMQAASTPYADPPLSVPGTIEIEYFDKGGEGVAYHDTSAGSHGQDYEQPPSFPPPSFRQPTDVDIYHSNDYSNGHLIVMQQGDWMKYTIDIAQSGTYTLEVQTYYWGAPGGTFHVEVDGVDKTGTMQLPGGTGWQMLTKTGVQLSAGRHVMRVVCDSNGSDGYYMGDIDFLRFTGPASASLAYWKFDEGSGTAASDSSGNGNTGTVSGASWTSGKVGTGALSFNGTSDFVSVASNTSITSIVNNFTVSFWVNPTAQHEIDAESTSGFGGVFNQKYVFGPSYYGGADAGAGISVGTNGVSVYEHATDYLPATLVYQGNITGWTHVTLVYQNKRPRLYINGTLVKTGLISPRANVHINPANLGGFSYGYFAGQLDDVRIYGSVLNASAIRTLAGQTATPVTYRASTDYSTTQGYRNWYYLYSYNDAEMIFDTTNNWWTAMEGGASCCLVQWATGGHPGYYYDAVRQWRAPQAGSIRITGTASVPSYGGDGVTVTIKKGSTVLWQQTIAGGNSTGVSFDQTTSVAQGDPISFVINRNGNNLYDSTGLDPTITFTPSSSEPPSSYPDFAAARLDPINRTGMSGEDLISGNYNWGLPLVSLPGRAGLDLGLSLAYNSLVWTKAGQQITYDADRGFPSPGFRLGFPVIQPSFHDTQTGKNTYLLISPSGSHVGLRYVGQAGTAAVYESADSSYLKLTDYGTGQLLLQTTDGTRLTYTFYAEDYLCTEIKDRNGNYITVNYNEFGHITSIIDTLARTVTFNYDSYQNLISITEQRNGQAQPWPVATFGYGNLTLHTSFNQLPINGSIQDGTIIPVLTQVGLEDGQRFNFNYTTWGQVSRIDHYVQDNVNPANWILLNYVSYNLPPDNSTAQSDCPRYTEKRIWAVGWNNDVDGVPVAAEEVLTTFSDFNFASGSRQVSVPDGTLYKEFFATTGWQRGMTTTSEVWSSGVKQKWTTLSWTQDNTSVAYQLNPRLTETNIYDASNNRRRTTIDYGPPAYQAYGLPYLVTEYGPDATSVLRQTYTDYQLDAAYTERRIIGLVSAQHISDGQAWLSKTVYTYDAGGSQLVATASPATQHDPSYNSSFGARGLLTAVYRYDATDLASTSKATVTQTGYNINGSVIFTRDPVGHQTSVSYTDSFSDAGSHPATFAYPTVVTNADGYSSTTQYDYYLGAVSRTSDAKGATVVRLYDAAGRVDRVYNSFNNAFKQFHYGPRYVVTLTSVKNLTETIYAIVWTDGLGQPYAMAQDAPVPGVTQSRYSAQFVTYDVLGRVKSQTNPTEIEPGWIPSGDDAAGWQLTWQTYDWKGRPRVTTNPDGTTTEAIYGGCGCAGGEITTLRDERGRRRRLTQDVLGRLSKVEELNWDQTVYSTTNYAYNALDQITNVNHAGQVRSFEYDGYGRLSARTTPEQGRTTFSYYADDLAQTVTDARGATSTFSYNGRHLLTSIAYSAPAGVTATPNVAISYDEVGNRTLMTDGLGYADYQYNQLSQLTSERRHFTELNTTYTTYYGYDLAGELTSMTMPWGEQVAYARDHVGRVTGVSGYAGGVQYASNLRYRAFGALKQMSYGNGHALSLSYDTRMRLTQWDIPNVMGWEYAYDTPNIHENTGRVAYARNLYDPTLDRSYDYDHVGRLWASHTGVEARGHTGLGSWGTPDGPYSFNQAYDVYGNVTQRNGWGGWNFAYPSATFVNNRMQANPQTGAAMLYDASGNLTHDGQESYSYDVTGQQTYASGTSLYQYYDGDALRAKKVEGGVASYYLRSSILDNQVLGEISNGQWKSAYVYLGTEKLVIQEGGQTRWVHADPVTKSQRATDASGTVVSVIDMDPFGGETSRSSNVQLMSSRFTSYERDGNGGDEAQARRFEGQWTRFSQPDPSHHSYRMSDPQSFNRYTYASNDPVNRVDPSGLGDEVHPFVCTNCNVIVPISFGSGNGAVVYGFGDILGGTILDELSPSDSLSGVGLDLSEPRGQSIRGRVRCPPTREQLAKNAAVLEAIKEAFKRADKFREERGYWVEHGGWIYQNPRTGRIKTFIKTPATSPPLPKTYQYLDSGYGVYLNNPPQMPGFNVVGLFHIHGQDVGANEYDDAAADQNKVPGVLGTPNGRIYPYGNYRLGIFNQGAPANCG